MGCRASVLYTQAAHRPPGRVDSLRKYGGMSGFPKRKESDCDAFDTGTAPLLYPPGSAMWPARELRGEEHSVVSVIGDGSLTGGMAYEALNNASRLKSNFIIVLNDNNMSISENVGGMSRYLNGIRTAQAYTDIKKGVEDTLKKSPGKGTGSSARSEGQRAVSSSSSCRGCSLRIWTSPISVR